MFPYASFGFATVDIFASRESAIIIHPAKIADQRLIA